MHGKQSTQRDWRLGVGSLATRPRSGVGRPFTGLVPVVSYIKTAFIGEASSLAPPRRSVWVKKGL